MNRSAQNRAKAKARHRDAHKRADEPVTAQVWTPRPAIFGELERPSLFEALKSK